jgi:hypothetical protein
MENPGGAAIRRLSFSAQVGPAMAEMLLKARL